MSTAVEICNSALVKLGVDPIASFSEDSKAARLLANQYPLIRDNLLQDHYWNFSIKTVVLAQLPEQDSRGSRFALPQDYEQAIKLLSNREYKIESGVLITKDGVPNLKYVWKNTDTSTYTSLFKEALAWAIAGDLAYSLVQSNTLATRTLDMARKKKLDAASVDAQEDFIDNIHADDFIEGRYGEIQSHFK
jgi:hypothetical protein